jgi:creatinine amidohydrolase/Fe(II)-dependent formamide hydrolase-like protein
MKEEADRNPPRGSEEPVSRSWFLERLPWPEVGRALARDPRLILPVGAMVQHGPHLPLGTNTIISEAVARAVSRDMGILRAPTFHYGVRGPERESFAGTAGIQRKTLHRALNELLAEWEDHGFQEFILLSAHRHEAHVEALLMALTSSAATTVVNLFAIEVGDILEGSPFSEHGGELETSLMLHLAPDLVRMEHAADVIIDSKTLRKYARGRVATPPPGSRGILGVPSRATPEKGAAVFSRYIQALKEILGDGSAVE